MPAPTGTCMPEASVDTEIELDRTCIGCRAAEAAAGGNEVTGADAGAADALPQPAAGGATGVVVGVPVNVAGVVAGEPVAGVPADGNSDAGSR